MNCRAVFAAAALVAVAGCTSLAAPAPSVATNSGTNTNSGTTSATSDSPATTGTSTTVAEITEPPTSTDPPIEPVGTQPADTETVGTRPGALDALAVLATITVENEHRGGYQRSLFHHWIDADGNGCDTRAEVLLRDTQTPPQVDPFGCHVQAGEWFSRYDDVTVTDPADIQIDHVVALKETWDSGAWAWTPERREAFANDLSDPRTLVAVTGASNGSKGDRDPSNWLPAASADLCPYLSDWISIKARWGLTMDSSEFGRIRNQITDNCPGLTVAGWTPAPV